MRPFLTKSLLFLTAVAALLVSIPTAYAANFAYCRIDWVTEQPKLITMYLTRVFEYNPSQAFENSRSFAAYVKNIAPNASGGGCFNVFASAAEAQKLIDAIVQQAAEPSRGGYDDKAVLTDWTPTSSTVAARSPDQPSGPSSSANVAASTEAQNPKLNPSASEPSTKIGGKLICTSVNRFVSVEVKSPQGPGECNGERHAWITNNYKEGVNCVLWYQMPGGFVEQGRDASADPGGKMDFAYTCGAVSERVQFACFPKSQFADTYGNACTATVRPNNGVARPSVQPNNSVPPSGKVIR